MQARFLIDPMWPEAGEIVVSVSEHWVDVWREEPALLDQPPYFCPNLFLRSVEEGLPGADRYSLFRRDWSDMEDDPDYGARVPRELLEKMLCHSEETDE